MLISHPESEQSTLESEAFSYNPEGRERIFSEKIKVQDAVQLKGYITVVICLRCREVSYRVPVSDLLHIKLNT